MNKSEIVEDSLPISRDTQKSLKVCTHPAYYNSLCVSCGESASKNPAIAKTVSITMNGGKQLQLSDKEARNIEHMKSSGLKERKKLALVLDLDHTLLHATPVQHLPAAEDLAKSGLKHLTIIDGDRGSLPKHHLIKLRPAVSHFLSESHKKFQLTIYTAGTRKYAEGIAKILDPDGIYFKDRIVSRSDNPNDPSGGLDKSLRKIFLGDTSMAVIIDDREDVWKGSQGLQLLLVKPFEYFRGAPEVNNSSGAKATGVLAPDVLNGDCGIAYSSPVIALSGPRPGQLHRPVLSLPLPSMAGFHFSYSSDHDDQLMRCLTLLEEIHTRFFPATQQTTDEESNLPQTVDETAITAPKLVVPPSVANILTNLKESVLLGCVVTFSGLIPMGEPNPEKYQCWKLAQSLGAVVTVDVIPQTTHLISAQANTAKVAECLSRKDVWVVHPDWLAFCRWTLCRVAEETFMITVLPIGQSLPNPVLTTSRALADALIKKTAVAGGKLGVKRKRDGTACSEIEPAVDNFPTHFNEDTKEWNCSPFSIIDSDEASGDEENGNSIDEENYPQGSHIEFANDNDDPIVASDYLDDHDDNDHGEEEEEEENEDDCFQDFDSVFCQ